MDRDVRVELYLALVLLGADALVLGALDAWREGAPENELADDLRNWNEAKVLETKEWLASLTEGELEAASERIRRYEEVRAALGEPRSALQEIVRAP